MTSLDIVRMKLVNDLCRDMVIAAHSHRRYPGLSAVAMHHVVDQFTEGQHAVHTDVLQAWAARP